MSAGEWVFSNYSSTTDPPSGVPLYLRSDEDGYMVTDHIGTCYGWGYSPGEALQEWADAVFSFCADIDASPAIPSLKAEAARYSQALAGGRSG